MYVNTWHGTPIKALGYDLPSGGQGTGNVVRNLLQADFLVSASPYMTEQLYARAYQLRNLVPARVIEEGYPPSTVRRSRSRSARGAGRGRRGGGPGARRRVREPATPDQATPRPATCRVPG